MSVSEIAFVVAVSLNLLWFGAGFHFFSLKSEAAARLLVPRSVRASPVFATIAASVRFLGGMNLALALLALLVLLNLATFGEPGQRAVFALVFAVAHGSQFYFNVPIALGGDRIGEALWPVLSGPMRFIFLVDATLMTVNAIMCVTLVAA